MKEFPEIFKEANSTVQRLCLLTQFAVFKDILPKFVLISYFLKKYFLINFF